MAHLLSRVCLGEVFFELLSLLVQLTLETRRKHIHVRGIRRRYDPGPPRQVSTDKDNPHLLQWFI